MRKKGILILILCVCAVIGIAGVQTDIGRSGREVKWQETTIAGEKSAAKGVHLTAELQKNFRLFWMSEFDVGEEQEAETRFSFSGPLEEEQEEETLDEVISLTFNSCQYDIGMIGEDILLSMPELYGKAYVNEKGERKYALLEEIEKMIETVKTNGTGVKEFTEEEQQGDSVYVFSGSYMEKEFLLRDYMDYCPLYMDMSYGIRGWAYRDEAGNVFSDEKVVYDAIAASLEIPLDGTEKLTVKVTKQETSQECTLSIKMESRYDLEMRSLNAVAKDRCYVACLPRSEGYDVENVRGIYVMPFEKLDDYRWVFESLEKVYSLDEEDEVVWMNVSGDEKDLLLVTEYDSEMYLHVIDLDSMKETQSVRIFGDAEENGAYESICVGEDLLVVYDSRNCFSVLHRMEEGQFEEVFTGDAGDFERQFPRSSKDAVVYRDGRLIIGRPLLIAEDDELTESCDLGMAVYDDSGLLYMGRFECSLEDGEDGWGLTTLRYSFILVRDGEKG